MNLVEGKLKVTNGKKNSDSKYKMESFYSR